MSSLLRDTKYFSSGLALESPHLSLPCRSSGTELSSPSAASRYRHTLLLLLLLPAGDGWWSRAAAGWDTSHRWGSSPGIQGIHPGAGGISGMTEETHQLVILLQQQLGRAAGPRHPKELQEMKGWVRFPSLVSHSAAGRSRPSSAFRGSCLSTRSPVAGTGPRAADNPPAASRGRWPAL